MSFMIGMQSFRNREISPFARSIVWDVFGPKCQWVQEGWGLMYDDRPNGVLYLDDNEFINGLGINRPGEDALYDLCEVARRVPCAISWDCHFTVMDAAFIDGMPLWLLDALPKPPIVISGGADLMKLLS